MFFIPLLPQTCNIPSKTWVYIWVRQAYICEYSVPHWWNCLGGIRKCGPVGRGVSLGMDNEVSKAHVIPSYLSLLLYFLLVDQMRVFSCGSSIMPARCLVSHHDGQRLTL